MKYNQETRPQACDCKHDRQWVRFPLGEGNNVKIKKIKTTSNTICSTMPIFFLHNNRFTRQLKVKGYLSDFFRKLTKILT